MANHSNPSVQGRRRPITLTLVEVLALMVMGDGVAHEGYQAAALGLRGIPGAAEAIMVERDVLLSEVTGAPVHIAHMSARASLRAVRKGKEAATRVTIGGREAAIGGLAVFVARHALIANGSVEWVLAALAVIAFVAFWRYRVGDFRIIARIDGDSFVVLVVRVGHRRLVYE